MKLFLNLLKRNYVPEMDKSKQKKRWKNESEHQNNKNKNKKINKKTCLTNNRVV